MSNGWGYYTLYWYKEHLHTAYHQTEIGACSFIEKQIEMSLNVLEDFTIIRGVALNLKEGVVAYG